MLVAQKYQDQIDRLKRNAESAKKTWKPNATRYETCQSFVFKSTLDMNDRGVADELQRPQLEVNVLQTYLSHLLGEFSRHTPSPSVQPINQDPKLANQALVVEGHLRYIFDCSKEVQYKVFRNILSGGYSVIKVTTDYINEKSSEQAIYLKNVLDDTQTGFDPMAKESHKGDGQFCFELVPKTKEELEEEFPDIDLSEVDFNSPITDAFPWYYTQEDGDGQKKVVVICNFFEKKNVYKMLYRVSDPSHPDNSITMTKDAYENLLADYIKRGIMTAPPVVLEKSRRKQIQIVHWQFTGHQVLSYEETDYRYLPLVFIDGDSILLKEGQFTKPYVFHAMDAQRMKNVCAQSIMNDIENMRQTDIIIASEALPNKPEYLLAWNNPQKANAALVYNAFSESNDNAPLQKPEIFPRQQVSPAVLQMFQLVDHSIQAVLGSYDAQQGLQSDMSGIAIENGAMQSNNAAKPYIYNYLIGMNQVCNIIVDLIPKYYTTLRTIPIINAEGKRSHQDINDSIKDPLFKIEYDFNDLEVTVTMDQNFEVQQARFIQTAIQLMKVSPRLEKFFSTDGIPLILDNITVKDIAKVKEQYALFTQKEEKIEQQQMQMQMQMNPLTVQQNIAELKAQSDDKNRNVDLIKAFLDQKIETRKAEAADAASQAHVLESQGKLAIAALQADAEDKRSQVEAAIAMDRHFNEKMQIQRDHLLKVLEFKEKKNEKSTSPSQNG